MSKALYRKYRSKSLGEVVGQSHVTDILTRSLAEGRISHAYLLTGPRGVGKTSIARILAHEINKLPYNEETTHLDIIEIDAASNNGVDDVRELREKVQIAPVMAEKKIYIIDEVHMLSKAAFNALLKTLEEPPEHAVFILATTDVDKLPTTIISRVQRFSFRAITPGDATAHLKKIAKEENISIDNDALELIALRGEGSFRDSISLLDQLRGIADKNAKITRELVEQSLGLAPVEFVSQLLDAYETKDLPALVQLLDASEQNGIQPTVLASQIVSAIRSKLAENPQFIPLLDQLLDVSKSSQPGIKLLTILAAYAAPKPKIAALSAPVAEVSAPLTELEKQATKAVPSLPVKQQVANEAATESSKQDASSVSNSSSSLARRDVLVRTSQKPPVERPKGVERAQGDQSTSSQPLATDFNWEKLIEYTRQNHVAVYSVLSKCSPECDGETLILYTSNTFYKKKLDDSKHRVNLIKSLHKIGAGDLLVETIPTSPPPKDSTAAAVAAIMGGGEEVTTE